MRGYLKKIALSFSFLIFLTYSGASVNRRDFKEDLAIKLNLKEESLARKYFESLKDYIYYFFQAIAKLKEKAFQVSDCIINLYSQLENSYGVQFLKGYLQTDIQHPIGEVVSDIKESEAPESANDFILSWIWNPVRSINTTEIEERLEEKAVQTSDYILPILNKLSNAYWFRSVKGCFLRSLPQPIKDVVIDIKESEAVKDVNDFILSWIWNPMRSINITEINEILQNGFIELRESDAFRRPHQFFSQCILNIYQQFIAKFCICHGELLCEEAPCKQKWSDIPFLKNIFWFAMGFASCFVIMYFYDYVKQLREEFDSYSEFLEAVKDQKYPLDEKNKKSDKNNKVQCEKIEQDEDLDNSPDMNQDFSNNIEECLTDED